MAEKSCVKRLQKEYRALCKEPVSHVVARPSPSDILEWRCVFAMKTDTSPTTGSVNTTAAEKRRLAKDSLAFNCKNVAFRKLFPEYVEKYNKEKLVSEQVSSQVSQEDKSRPKLEKLGDSSVEDAKGETMNKAPIYQNYEASNYGAYEFDPQVDFTQFLEEARQHAREMNLQSSLPLSESGKGRVKEEKKSRSSWKHSLLKWWKAEKKTKPIVEQTNSSHISNPRKGHVSGPIFGSGRRVDAKPLRQASGPLANLFSPSKRVENEIPYMCLDQLNNPHGVKAYGPVYLVT
ncbi:unnamed protein product [Dovyalis caffra]|uniref:Uncharacterized protein n=1 Tax=Dovyalis caffra TaxID=77055 RepID=A0AAV1SSD2_9ROSI|nr:unnamed protein product [Dovyalis caffra]